MRPMGPPWGPQGATWGGWEKVMLKMKKAQGGSVSHGARRVPGYPLGPQGYPMGIPWGPHGAPMGRPWAPAGALGKKQDAPL